ncbi:MAG: aminotransferase class III-fold pyridoxal phosphate-dependent enzyme [Christensenellaceae bacterium]|jgi:glutamate-1-semialdehyde 2,1-aminomutase
MGKGQELYKHAKKVIPGGTQLLSKRPEQFLPEKWPAYYSKAKGCAIWDLDGNVYIDVSYMGIGANVLGYAVDEVDDVAVAAIRNGGMSTLNAPEEVLLADELLLLHPWAEMVRYAKAGGEAMAQAVRIARAHTGRDIVLFCGYHGWQDWYLAANLSEGDALADNHLSGLEPAGVPRGLRGTNLPFHYNDYEEFLALAQAYEGQIAAVVMEPIRNDFPQNGFLEEIREYTQKNDIVLVFDEVTAGFRLNCGGSHLVLGVMPDMAIFGKGIANGYPLTAVIGTKKVMAAAQDTFISSTFWTERIGFAAALAAIRFYKENSVEKHLKKIGMMIKAGWQQAANRHKLQIEIGGIDPLSHFAFAQKPLFYKTYFTQEMLKKGYLASTAFYVSFAHTEEIVQAYLQAVDEVFAAIADIQDIESALDGPVCHSGFQRLN